VNRRLVIIICSLVLIVGAVVAVVVSSRRFDTADGTTSGAPGTGLGGTPTILEAPPQSDEAAKNLGWRRIDGDEFDGSAVDTKNWNVYDGYNKTAKMTWSAKQCAVRNGLLTLIGAPDTAGTTCGLAWRENQTYGRWEVRARFPAPAAIAYDPVFLLWPQDDANWTSVGEIDFAEEYDPNRQYIESWMHGPGNVQAGYWRKYVDLTTWHNFAVEWQADHITCYIDGVAWLSLTDKKNVPQKPMHLVLQQNFVPRTPADVPPIRSTVEIDWVHIYR
jgi:beta-glucanase (GH16 family)